MKAVKPFKKYVFGEFINPCSIDVKRLLSAVLSVVCVSTLYGQELTQNIRGRVVDAMSGYPIPFASVVILNTSPVIGTMTDTNGIFNLPDVPVGRYDIQFSYVGYTPATVNEVVVSSSKETFINVEMRENITSLKEVEIKPDMSKEEPLNKMATVSARMLSVEEAQRYAGGFDDPARLASAFAGVASNVGTNGIVVRGNAPRSLQWKMEGIEIPNPNHFADLNAFGGGGLTALSSRMLANSDFFTGAFPAEYNNALSGVFDIFMRDGNNRRHEHTAELGVIGIDASSEGPFKKNGNSSYLFNYRYSTLSLVEPLLPEGAEGIGYQDLSFKLNFPTKKSGVFKVWGIGLKDQSGQTAKRDPSEWKYMQDREEGDANQFMGATGISHSYFFNNNTNIKTTLASTVSGLDWKTERLNDRLELLPQRNIRSTNWNFVLKSSLNKKFSSTHTNKTGITATGLMYDMLLQDAGSTEVPPITITEENGFSSLLSLFTSSSIRLSEMLTLNIGVTGQFFTLNNRSTVEPRVGIKSSLNDRHSIGLAYGLHSRLEKLNYYFTKTPETGDELVNKNMDFSKSHHLVLSYRCKLSENAILKAEPYFQYLYRIPVVPDSSFSFINLQDEWFFNQRLENTGEGRNYGIDLTFEKYLSLGYYYMITSSIFNSEYLGGDGVWRNTAFDRRFLINVLGGKEWQTGKKNQNVFGVNARVTYQGGDPYTPYDESASLAAQRVIYNTPSAYTERTRPTLIVHFTASYKINKKKASHEIALKILNTTMENDFYGHRYNYQTHAIDMHLEPIMIPNLSYKIEF